MAEFFNMGGYAGFVWPSWGVAVIVIAVISVRSFIKAKQINAALTAKKIQQNG